LSAIIGPARADLYWGAGDDAGRVAGRIRHPGRFVMLLPRELDMIAAGRDTPLPVPKPKILEIEVKKHGEGVKQHATWTPDWSAPLRADRVRLNSHRQQPPDDVTSCDHH